MHSPYDTAQCSRVYATAQQQAKLASNPSTSMLLKQMSAHYTTVTAT